MIFIQPSSGYQYTVVSGGVGTTVVKNINAVLQRILVPGTYVGTINFHDANAAAGTNATSQIFSMGLPTTSIPQSIEVGVNCSEGLLYQATGTPTCTIVWN